MSVSLLIAWPIASVSTERILASAALLAMTPIRMLLAGQPTTIQNALPAMRLRLPPNPLRLAFQG